MKMVMKLHVVSTGTIDIISTAKTLQETNRHSQLSIDEFDSVRKGEGF